MPGYRLGEAAKTLGVSVDTVRRMVDDGRLTAVRTSGGQRLIDGESLAAIAKPKHKDRSEASVKQSARNRFPGIITRVIKDKVAAQVEIQAGPHRLVSLITRDAVDELDLRPGMAAIAVVKATNVHIELPRD
ncbi:MAG: helix-turn-helix domain-containing protein [Chloroflexi bacterium]|nr:MAG: helix-turn-helix domain-containing protein [Chloroflexota bacterium]TMF37192.1 MAG: helix-turn-helix domain-containing protein [Chloroflexota bacterium]